MSVPARPGWFTSETASAAGKIGGRRKHMPTVEVNQRIVNDFLAEHAEALGLNTNVANPLLFMVATYTNPENPIDVRLAAANKCLPYLHGHPPDPDKAENQFDDPTNEAKRSAVFNALVGLVQNPGEAPNLPMPSTTGEAAYSAPLSPEPDCLATVTAAEDNDPEQGAEGPREAEVIDD